MTKEQEVKLFELIAEYEQQGGVLTEEAHELLIKQVTNN